MPQYHLIYFNLRARGELTRWLLQYGGVTYTEERIEFADWPARKPSTPTGKLPILMVDDEPLTQSIAIARYVAQEVGLVPEDNLQAAFANSLADSITEMMDGFYSNKMSKLPEEEKENKFRDELTPKSINPLLDLLENHFEDKEWYCCNKISWVDLMISVEFDGLTMNYPKLLENYPKVAAQVNKVKEIPKIKNWVKSRPETFL